MDFRLALIPDCKRLPCDCCCLAQCAANDAIDDLVCDVHWSLLLNGYRCETRWNDLSIEHDDFGDDIVGGVVDGSLAAQHHAGPHNDGLTYYLDSCALMNVVQNAATEFPDCLWP